MFLLCFCRTTLISLAVFSNIKIAKNKPNPLRVQSAPLWVPNSCCCCWCCCVYQFSSESWMGPVLEGAKLWEQGGGGRVIKENGGHANSVWFNKLQLMSHGRRFGRFCCLFVCLVAATRATTKETCNTFKWHWLHNEHNATTCHLPHATCHLSVYSPTHAELFHS